MALPAPPELSDDAGPWLLYPDVIERIRKARQCGEASSELWMNRITAARQLRGRCRYYKLPREHPQWAPNSRTLYPGSPSMYPEHDWVDPLDRKQWGMRWEPADMREPWVRDHTEWNEQQLNELLGIACTVLDCAHETTQHGRPPDPIRDAVIDGLQSALDACDGKMPNKEFAFRTRTLAAQNGRAILPESTRRDWQKAAKQKWGVRKGR